MKATVLIVTGEASGDLHGAGLARELFRQSPGIRILGMGGERMREAGVEVIFDNRRLGVMGAMDVFWKWRIVLEAYSRVKREIREGALKGIVLVDSPDFNLRVARLARRRGIPTAYYIGPKFWAWRPGRVRSVARWVDRMLVIFPFEKAFYEKAGVDCEYVGNPLMDEAGRDGSRSEIKKQLGFSPDGPVLGLLPGSRPMEIERLFELQLRAFDRIRQSIPALEAVVPVAPSVSLSEMKRRLGAREGRVRLIEGRTREALACSDAAIVASGTATLEAAIAGTPPVVVYKVGWLTEFVARLLVRIKNVSLVNIIAGRRIVPEFLQSEATSENLAGAVLHILENRDVLEKLKKELHAVREALGAPGAAQRAAASVLSLMDSARKEATA